VTHMVKTDCSLQNTRIKWKIRLIVILQVTLW